MPRPLFMGAAEKVAGEIEHWHQEGGMDILLIRQDHPVGFGDFIQLVVPILREKGIFRKEYEDDTVRGNSGLSYPENRYKIDE